jgi:hypothetical protein
MKKVRYFSMALAAAFLVGATPQALAQAAWGEEFYRKSPPMAHQAESCQKMCARDLSPCDPIYFKTADGRCAGILSR